MNFLLAFGVLVAVLSSAASQECNIPGECTGNLFGATYENSVTDCLSSCQGASECEWFTFNTDGGYCGLQTTCDSIDADSCSSCISGEDDCSPSDFTTCDLPGMCQGTILHQEPADSQTSCQNLCATYDGCNFYTYDGANTHCMLFEDCSEQSGEFCQSCVSGQPGCDVGPTSPPGSSTTTSAGQTTTTPSEPSGDLILGGGPFGTDFPIFSTTTHPTQPTSFWGSLEGPYETNIWWENLVLDGGDSPIATFPYLVKLDEMGLHLCYPEKVVDQAFIFMAFVDNWIVGATEGLGSRLLIGRDHFGAIMNYETGLEIPLVRGMPYATFKYNGITPNLESIHSVLSVNGGMESSVTGTKFNIELNNGHIWIMYTSSDITIDWSGSIVTANTPFTGTMRLAVMVDGVDESELDTYSGKVPIGGSIEAVASGDSSDITINWKSEGNGDLLMVALPHHMDVMSNAVTASYKLNGIRGDMIGVVGETWLMTEELTPIEWFAPGGIEPSYTESIRAALNEDVVGNDVVAGDPYFGGKQMAKLARLALIAEDLGEEGLAQQFREKFQPVLESWLDGTNPDSLLYDTTWGGLVSTNGLEDSAADFGMGFYQDHHFHFGYHIYAAAVLAKADPTWGTTYEDKVMHYVRDIIDPSGGDPQYIFARAKDWYTGHSWANGIITAFADSKNQESTSEGVNAWYAVYLYGLAMNNARLRDLGRLALATEIRSAQKYWQITSADEIYPEPFSTNKVVGILWSTKVDYATWFGANIEFIHCIQMLPFTPISEELLREEWITEEYPVLVEAFNTADEGWRGYIIMAHAVIDSQAAWEEAQLLTSFDDGNTKSNTYYWIATRP